MIIGTNSVVRVELEMVPDKDSKNGYGWTSGNMNIIRSMAVTDRAHYLGDSTFAVGWLET